MRVAWGLALAALACGAPDVRPDGEGTDATAETAPASDADTAAATAAGPENELRTYRLLLVNRWPIRAVVYADAGAGRVLLDTVRRLDSTRVDVDVRAVELRLIAEDRFGERLGARTVDLVADSLNRWEIPRSEGPGQGATGPGGDG